MSEAERIHSLGDAAAAVRAYRLLHADFQGMTNLSAVEARLTALRNDPRLRRTEAAESAVAERDRAWLASMLSFSASLERSSPPPSLDVARRALDLDRMQREAARADDSTSAIAARRSLERVFTHFAFYAPRQFFDARRYAHAAAALRIARIIKPDDGGACFWHARALAQTGDKPNALQALECAAASRQMTAQTVEGDPLLAPLHGESRYDAVVRQLRSGG